MGEVAGRHTRVQCSTLGEMSPTEPFWELQHAKLILFVLSKVDNIVCSQQWRVDGIRVLPIAGNTLCHLRVLLQFVSHM